MVRSVSVRLGLALLLVSLPLAAGCSTHVNYLTEIRREFFAGDLEQARKTIDEHAQSDPGAADVLKLDRGMVELVSGNPREAERYFREVRDSFDYLQQKSLAESSLAMLTDDNTLAYPGEDYERVLLRTFLALSNLLHDGGDAQAYGLQTVDLQETIIRDGMNEAGQNLKASYKRVALGAYVFAALREANYFDYDDAARYWTKVVEWEPRYPFAAADVERARRGRHSAKGNGVLYAFTLVGRGPYKEEAVEVPSTVALLVADRVLSATGKHTLPPTVAPIKVPKVVRVWSRIHHVDVAVNRQPAASTATIADLGETAVQQNEAVFPEVLGRAVARRVVKKGVLYAAKEATKTQNGSIANLAVDVGGVIWEATEAADTRCWGLLPDRVQVVRLELPAGEHQVALRPAVQHGAAIAEATATVTIADGRNTFLLASFADGRLLGKIISKQQ